MKVKESIESQVLDSRPGMLLIEGRFRAFAFPKHLHEGYSIGLIEGGVNRFQCEGQNWEAPKGTLCVVNPDQIHTGEADNDGWKYTNLFVSPEALSQALGYDNVKSLNFKEHVFHDAAIEQHFANLIDMTKNGDEALGINCEYTLMMARLGQIANVPVVDRLASGLAISRVKDLLDSISDRAITLNELAAAADMRTFHLVHSFTEAFDISPYAYHLNRRLLAAQRMIENGVLLAEVAFRTGFTDQAHFTRHFRRFLGVTPGLIAKKKILLAA